MAAAQSTVIYVLDYDAMGQPHKRPQRLHRTDCSHPDYSPVWRLATAQELTEISRCRDCVRRDG
jgi:hypothetical protein